MTRQPPPAILVNWFLILGGLLCLIGCGSVPPSKDSNDIAVVLDQLYDDFTTKNSSPTRYFVLFVPDYLTTRYTRNRFMNDLLGGFHANTHHQNLLYQENWGKLFLIPEQSHEQPALIEQQQEYGQIMNSFDQGKAVGLLAMRSHITSFDRFRRLRATELMKLDPWMQDMLRIPVDYTLGVDAIYQGYQNYLYQYELVLTLQDIRTGQIDAYVRGMIYLRYRLQ